MLKKLHHKINSLKPRNKTAAHYFEFETKHPTTPKKRVPSHLVHPSVFEPNHPHSEHPDHSYEKAVFSWIAPEYLQHPKTANWWVGFSILTLLAIVLEALSGNWTMLLATVVFIFTYWFTHEFKPPHHTKIVISEIGIKIGHRKISYSEIESFWIIYKPGQVKRLIFRVKSAIFTDLIIELEEENPIEIRSFLRNRIREDLNQREGLGETILRLLKL